MGTGTHSSAQRGDMRCHASFVERSGGRDPRHMPLERLRLVTEHGVRTGLWVPSAAPRFAFASKSSRDLTAAESVLYRSRSPTLGYGREQLWRFDEIDPGNLWLHLDIGSRFTSVSLV